MALSQHDDDFRRNDTFSEFAYANLGVVAANHSPNLYTTS